MGLHSTQWSGDGGTLWSTRNHGENAGMGGNDGFIIKHIGCLNDPKYYRNWMVSLPFLLVVNNQECPTRRALSAQSSDIDSSRPFTVGWWALRPSMRLEWFSRASKVCLSSFQSGVRFGHLFGGFGRACTLGLGDQGDFADSCFRTYAPLPSTLIGLAVPPLRQAAKKMVFLRAANS